MNYSKPAHGDAGGAAHPSRAPAAEGAPQRTGDTDESLTPPPPPPPSERRTVRLEKGGGGRVAAIPHGERGGVTPTLTPWQNGRPGGRAPTGGRVRWGGGGISGGAATPPAPAPLHTHDGRGAHRQSRSTWADGLAGGAPAGRHRCRLQRAPTETVLHRHGRPPHGVRENAPALPTQSRGGGGAPATLACARTNGRRRGTTHSSRDLSAQRHPTQPATISAGIPAPPPFPLPPLPYSRPTTTLIRCPQTKTDPHQSPPP